MNAINIARPATQRMRDLDTNDKIVILLVAIMLIRGVLYALVSPAFSAPDEKGHYDYIASLYEHGLRMIEGRERGQPPLYYLLSLPIFSVFAGQTSELQVYALAADHVSLASLLAVRCFSVLLTTITVPLAYWTARELCPEDRFVSLGTAAFVALVPAYGWVGASMNNDGLASVFSSVLILLLIRGIPRGFSPRGILWIVVIAAAGIATKSTTLPAAALAPLVIAIRLASQVWPGRRATRIVLIAAGLSVLFFASPLRNLVIAPLGRIMNRPMTLDFLAADRVKVFMDTLDIWPFVYQFKTFWGSFSNDSVQLPSAVYLLLAILTAVSLLGLFSRSVGSSLGSRVTVLSNSAGRARPAQLILLIGLVVLEWAISLSRFYNNQSLQLSTIVAGWNDNFTLMQGRFLYPAIVPIAFLFAWGLRALLPAKWAEHTTWALVGILIAIDWIAVGTLALGGNSWQIYSSEN